ncbi:hypothetical protein FSP39_017968 [Pinctada imbricata]|uniref:Centrosome and spindle pole-associated protein 1 C-terminal domain-containing protein n=1 Tax=Pinctada imbricata TaxID=66713 RepID=A0AA88XVM5_PINIB|nr:hypothetical protein FSP39_017968 [Pinctada imbricata]
MGPDDLSFLNVSRTPRVITYMSSRRQSTDCITRIKDEEVRRIVPEKTGIDYGEWEKSFQEEKRREYNEYLQKILHYHIIIISTLTNTSTQPKHRRSPTPPQMGMRFGEYEDFKKKVDQQRKNEYRRELQKQRKEHATHLRKAPTPPQIGMKFGEFEDFKKRVEQQRKDEYREDLEKQQRDQAFHKAARKGQGTSIADMSGRPPKQRPSERDRDRWRKERRRRDDRDQRIENNRVEEFKKMLAINTIGSDIPSQGIDDESDHKNPVQNTLQKYKTEQEKSREADYEEMLRMKKQLDFEKLLEENKKREAVKAEKSQDRDRRTGERAGEGGAGRADIRPPYIPIDPAPIIPPLNLDISVSHRDYPAPKEEDYTARQEPYAPPKGRDRRDELSEAEKRRHQFKEERSKDYNDYLQKRRNAYNNRTWREVKETESGLPLHDDFERRKQLLSERNREYNELLQQPRKEDYQRTELQKLEWPLVDHPIYRRHPQSEYKEQIDSILKMLEEMDEKNVPADLLEELLKKLKIKQRLAEEHYNLQMLERDEYERARQDYDRNRPPSPSGGRAPPPRAPTQPARAGPSSQGGGLFSNMGQHDDEIRKLNEERKKEYQQLLAEQARSLVGIAKSQAQVLDSLWEANPRTYQQPLDRPPLPPEREVRTRGNVRPEAEEYGATLKGIRQHDSAERHGTQDGRPSSEPYNQRKDEDIFATLPGIHYNGSAQRGKPPAGPKSGWQTPTYDDLLERKRREEAQYRRDDPGMRPYASEGAINNIGADDDRYRRLDQEYDDKKVRFRDQRAQNSILDDDNWLSTGKDQEYRQLRSPEGPRHQSQPPPSRYRDTSQEAPREDMANASYYATLPVGHVDRDSAKRRRKEKYKEELQLQMREQEAAKRRERVEDLKVNASGFLDPEHTVHRQKGLGDPNISPRNRNIRSPEVKPYHTKIVSSPRGGFGGDYDGGGGGFTRRERGRPREREYRGGGGLGGGGGGGLGGLDGGILDRGFEGILTENRRSLSNNIPPGLAYQPSTYVTGGGSSGLNQAYSSIDEAYHFYGLKNPLEPEPSAGGVVPSLHFDRLDDYGGRRSPRVTFDDTVRARDRSRERISPYQFPSDEEIRSRSRSEKLSYKEELERQVQEKRLQKQREREEKERYERKLDEEIKNYNPFGRGGGGAPLKDQQGNVTADLRQFRGGQNSYRGSSRSPPPRESPRFRSPSSPKDDLYNVPPVQTDAQGDPTYARGGHGIFGNPRTDEEKTQADRYKDDLRRQIEDKKRREQEDRERQRLEDEKENRRLEEQRQRIQQEFEEEQRKKREKEEDARKRNDEMRQEAEKRKKDQDRKKREDDERKQRERREQEERERHERNQQALEQQHQRETASPPIPALRSKIATTDGEPSELNYTTIVRDSPDRDSPRPGTSEDTHRKSPPIPALRKEDPPTERRPPPEPTARPNSSDVLKELASMRKQLQSERRRVENALENQKNEPDVFDPRLVQRPPPKEIDVFERAKMGAPTVPVRTADNANPRNLQEFNELKYKNDTDSRRAFRSMFPDAPVTNSALETQQDAMLRHQEDTLKNLKDRKLCNLACIDYIYIHVLFICWHINVASRLFPCAGSVAPPIGARQGTVSPRSLLQSNSAFIDVDGLNHFPDDFEDLPRRNESARYRRRERITVSPRPESQPVNPMTIGSVTSLDVDCIQRKNDARLRRLHQMNADEISVGDPDDILDRFMAKQRYNRPPSGQTLQDDTWLRPGSKAI